MPKARTHSRAFTLIELIAVIVITAILAGVAVPAVLGIADGRSAAAARTIAGHLAFARERALNNGNRVWISFDTGAESYELLAEPDAGLGYADAVPLNDPTTGRPMGLTLDQDEFVGVGIASASFDGSAVVGFDWLGGPLGFSGAALADDGVVTLDSGVTVTVATITGDVSIGP